MSREIKFRGKRTDNGEWVIGNLITMESAQQYGDSTMFSNCWIVEINESLDIRAFSSGNAVWADNEFIQVDPETVGQYTGLRDKNGKEIYAGDMWQARPNGVPYVVTWHETGWYLLRSDVMLYENIDGYALGEVVGNIHEGVTA